MAASPLAEIDWDNLQNENLITALNLLELAFSERMNIPLLTNCSMGSSAFVEDDRFPFQNNSPDYGKTGWPAVWGGQIFSLGGAGRILRAYLSETKIADLLGGTTYSRFAPVFDDATMFADLGITEYPSLEVVNATDVKIWYDILTSLKWIYSSFDRDGTVNTETTNYDSTHREGLVDETNAQGPAFPYMLTYGDFPVGSAPIGQFPTDEDLLFTGPSAKQSAAITSAYFHQAYQSTGIINNPPTRIQALIAKGYNRFDIADLVATGHTGQPQDFRAYGNMNITSNDFGVSTAFADYETAYLYQDSVVAQFPTPTRVNTAGSIYEYEIPFAVPAAMPNAIGDFTADFNNRGCSTFDLWDQEDGFIYYTP